MKSEQHARIDSSGDFNAGNYVLTHTVSSQRINLFCLKPGKERHIGTLISGSRTKIGQFHQGARDIIRALAALDR
ncbi:MAG: hypothetical protein M9924_21190 [Rhizobiaceae bacterium]|nr:hypothetical protein [Rhizobiaceae bacterium]